MNYTRGFWIISLVTAALRLLLIGRIGLSGDEAHYWTYTQYLDLSYFDHPPAIAYIIKCCTLVFGDTVFAVRFPAVLLFFGTSALVYLLARDMFGEKTAFWSVALLNMVPVFSFLGAVLTVPDAPLAFLWMLFIYLFWKILRTEQSAYWYLLGAVLGLALLSKYNAVLLVPSAALFLLFMPKARFWLARREPYLALLIAGVFFLPVIIWNMENGWASFGFQLRHGFGKTVPHFSLALLGKCLGAQAGYISPFLLIGYVAVIVWLVRHFLLHRDESSLLILSFSLPTLLLFNGIASFNEILPHWPATGYLVVTIAAAHAAVRWWWSRWFRAAALLSAGMAVLLTVLVPLQAAFKLLPPEVFLPKAEAMRLEDGITRAEKVDITNELYGWPEAGKAIADLIAAAPEPKPFIFTHRHYIASQLSFYVPGHPRIWCLSDRIDAYDFWQRDLRSIDGRDGIFVTNDYFYIAPETVFPFAAWQQYDPLPIFRGKRKIRLFWITAGKEFSAARLPAAYTADLAGQRLPFAAAVRKLDYDIFWYINTRIHDRVLDACMAATTRMDMTLGINTSLVFLLIAVGFILWHIRRERFWAEFLLVMGIIAVGGILVHVLKDFFCRARPLSVFGDERVRYFCEKLYSGSFPSGHTQIAFSVAAFLATRLKKYAVLFYCCAAVMGFSRIYVGSHFPSDVLVGAVLGIAVAYLMTALIKTE